MSEERKENENCQKRRFFWGRHDLVSGFFIVFILCVGVYGAVSYFHYQGVVKRQNRIIEICNAQISQRQNGFGILNIPYFQQHDIQENFLHEIKTLLDLEFNRIQNEFEIFEIWAGIITIIFLIFSFYSLFKSEEIERQSKDSLKHIEEIEVKSEHKLQSIGEDAEKEFSKLDERYEEWEYEKRKATKESLNEATEKVKKSLFEEYEEVFKNFMKQMNQKIDDNIKNTNEHVSDEINKQIQQYNTQFDEIMEKIKKQSESFRLEPISDEKIDDLFREKDDEDSGFDEPDQPLANE